ncbi:hypothetical protein DOTSEDRAFT_73655 [Dothistroma septosporum NZE10]|uniref:Uncharacterized protein n=1 Tax=Dothistroma septosporum (strain NZE10 / CBS 128990) TaxID=675120 RepID=N1PG31_DOTSN|nr:hypothetical protein DOTSEDRAFT_73655 [Dothistroma septosporum NZE10]
MQAGAGCFWRRFPDDSSCNCNIGSFAPVSAAAYLDFPPFLRLVFCFGDNKLAQPVEAFGKSLKFEALQHRQGRRIAWARWFTRRCFEETSCLWQGHTSSGIENCNNRRTVALRPSSVKPVARPENSSRYRSWQRCRRRAWNRIAERMPSQQAAVSSCWNMSSWH